MSGNFTDKSFIPRKSEIRIPHPNTCKSALLASATANRLSEIPACGFS